VIGGNANPQNGERKDIEKNALILAATWSLTRGDKEELLHRVRAIQQQRKEKQPLSFPSCGSVFKRPKNNYAGALIEKAGLKGFSIGGAQVSELHANFIINRGGATAQDVLALIVHIQQKVYEISGILLETEVILVGNFKTTLWQPPSNT